jgi:hypothetical protein
MPRAPQELRTYFITSVTANRRRLFQVEQNATLFLDILQEQRTKKRIQLHAFVTYIHQNPIRANVASEPSLYPHSSANPTHQSDSAPTHLS